MLGLVRFIATVWLAIGVVVVLAAAVLLALHYTNLMVSPVPVVVLAVVGGAGLIGLVVGWKVWDAAVGEGSRLRRGKLRVQTAQERAEKARQTREAAGEVWRLIDAHIEKHTETLRAKRGELVKTDDYGKPVTDAWHAELDYFWERVVRPALVQKVSGEAYREALQKAADWAGTPEARKSPDLAMREAVRARVEEKLAAPPADSTASDGS